MNGRVSIPEGMKHTVIGSGKDHHLVLIVADHGRPRMEKVTENPASFFVCIVVSVFVILVVAVDKVDDGILFGIICRPKPRSGEKGVGFRESVARVG